MKNLDVNKRSRLQKNITSDELTAFYLKQTEYERILADITEYLYDAFLSDGHESPSSPKTAVVGKTWKKGAHENEA